MSVSARKIENARSSMKVKSIVTFGAIVGAVVVPQLFHIVGAVSGLGTALGETFLPMHLPIILAGIFAGPFAGAAAGLLGPLVSHLLTGMPGNVMLPFMMIELCSYGLLAGLLGNRKMPDTLKVLAVQLGGRLIRAAAILCAIFVLGSESVKLPAIWMASVTGLPGIILQLTVLPLAIYRINGMISDEN